MNTAQLAPGETRYVDMTAPDGRLLTVRVDRHHDHTAITVVSHMNTGLDRAMPHDEADAYLAFLESEWATGTQMWLLEEQAGILTTTAAALDHFEAEMVAELNTVLDEAHAELTASAEAEQAAVADIMADTKRTGGWNALRQAHTRTGKPTSRPMDRILGSAVNGYIPRGQEATSTQLIALHRRGKVALDWQTRDGHRRIAGAWLAGQQPTEMAA